MVALSPLPHAPEADRFREKTLHARSALLTTAIHRIPFSDAVAVTLAENSGAPLLVADEDTYQTLKALESVRPTPFVAWLPDVLVP